MNTQGFFSALFDFSFRSFVTTRIISLLYGLMLLLIGIFTLMGIGTALMTMFSRYGGFFQGLGMLIVMPLLAVVYLILARVWTEIIIVLFRIAENTSRLVELKEANPQAPLPTTTPPAPPAA